MKKMTFTQQDLKKSVERACSWITDVAMVASQEVPAEQDRFKMDYANWDGAIRGEYSAGTKKWDFFCPIWHGGQAVKALVLAYRVLKEKKYLDAAMRTAGFIGRNRITDKDDPDYGMILSYEDKNHTKNTSAGMECLDGLFHLYEETNDKKYLEWITGELDWLSENAYVEGEGVFKDYYEVDDRKWIRPNWYSYDNENGRSLLEDAVFVKAYRLTGNERYREIFVQVANRLLALEYPLGNWVKMIPAHYDPETDRGSLHPRHAYWQGLPMIEVSKATGKRIYLDCARRAGEWIAKAMRVDGGMFRGTAMDFNTDSFGHATSGSASGVNFWVELLKIDGNEKWIEPINRALKFCMKVQFIDPEDKNLKGAILEKVLPPDGTDANPYYLRDLSTIFFVQGACNALLYNDGELFAES